MKITKDSHVDHGLTKAQIDYIAQRLSDFTGFFIDTLALPQHLGTVPCALHGPAVGEAPVSELLCTRVSRGDRTYTSRLCKLPMGVSECVTIIAGPHGDDEPCILYTAFGGPLAPKEPGDPTLTEAGLEESRKFWAAHALSGSAEDLVKMAEREKSDAIDTEESRITKELEEIGSDHLETSDAAQDSFMVALRAAYDAGRAKGPLLQS